MQADNWSGLLLSFPSTCTLSQSNAWYSWLVLRRSPVSISASKSFVLTEGFSNSHQSPPADVEIVPQIRPRHVLSASFPTDKSNPVTERAGEAVTLLTYIEERTGFESWPGHRLFCLKFSWFSSEPPGTCRDCTSIMPLPPPSKSLQIYRTSVILPCELL
jgi:hypothetical protein